MRTERTPGRVSEAIGQKTSTPKSPNSKPDGGAPAASSEEAPTGGGDGVAVAEGAPLVMIGNRATTPDETAVFQRVSKTKITAHDRRVATDIARQLITETCADIRVADKIRYCGRHVRKDHPGDIPIVHHPDGYAYTTGLQTCSSVWACPACSYKIRKKRALEIAVAIALHKQDGGSLLYLTLTMAHQLGEDLDELWSIIQDGFAYCRSGAKWSRFKQRHGIVGYIRALEVTHGGNGWHPHLHVLIFVEGEIDPFEIGGRMGMIGRYFRRQWITYMHDQHDRHVSTEIGVDLRIVKADDAEGVGMYCTKAGYEMALADSKIGRSEGSRSPFAIARDAAETGDMADISLFREWIKSSHGRRSLTWSHGLRDRFGLGADRSDEELATEQDGGEVVATVDRELWWRIVSTRIGARSRFLALLDNGPQGLTTAVEFLDSAGIGVEIQHQSDGPPRLALTKQRDILATNKPQPKKEATRL